MGRHKRKFNGQPKSNLGKCPCCGEPVRWLKTRSGKNIPCEPEGITDQDRDYDQSKHHNHFADCEKFLAQSRGEKRTKQAGDPEFLLHQMNAFRDEIIKLSNELEGVRAELAALRREVRGEQPERPPWEGEGEFTNIPGGSECQQQT